MAWSSVCRTDAEDRFSHHHPPAQLACVNLIEAYRPEDAWTPIPYWMDNDAEVADTT